ncbi:hypothetical protein FACS1894102_7400 [Spirochaetia bacterium]|nr:hypothetical protein FACS1894102_7400 [Spirochaetia bacterium]
MIKQIFFSVFCSVILIIITGCDGLSQITPTGIEPYILKASLDTSSNTRHTAIVSFRGDIGIFSTSDHYVIKGIKRDEYSIRSVENKIDALFTDTATSTIKVSPHFELGDTITISGTGRIHGSATFTVPE